MMHCYAGILKCVTRIDEICPLNYMRGGESHTHFILAKQVFQGEAISIAFRQISLRLCRHHHAVIKAIVKFVEFLAAMGRKVG